MARPHRGAARPRERSGAGGRTRRARWDRVDGAVSELANLRLGHAGECLRLRPNWARSAPLRRGPITFPYHPSPIRVTSAAKPALILERIGSPTREGSKAGFAPSW